VPGAHLFRSFSSSSFFFNISKGEKTEEKEKENLQFLIFI
jgi:hypothetical protein